MSFHSTSPTSFAIPGPSAPILINRLNAMCWIWVKAKNRRDAYGYGDLKRYKDGKHYLVHRFFYERFNGPIPEGMYVCHRCDTPACYNPAHLFLGTQTDNMRDMSDKKRMAVQRTTHCVKGHEFSTDNTSVLRGSNGRPRRVCKICASDRVMKCRLLKVLKQQGVVLKDLIDYLKKYDPENSLLKGID